MASIWVICIDHDYGVWAEAGYFLSEEKATAWAKKYNDQRAQFYAAELLPAAQMPQKPTCDSCDGSCGCRCAIDFGESRPDCEDCDPEDFVDYPCSKHIRPDCKCSLNVIK